MSSLSFSKYRLQAFLEEARKLQEIEFPYQDSRIALETTCRLFQKKLDRLERLDEKSDPTMVAQECRLSLTALFQFVPRLGFILRSTNVRNAFEAFRPLLRLARQVLEHDIPPPHRTTRLVVSSEWSYSPFVFRESPDLPGSVFIGLPAPESSNPLVLPLAGHELGHALWARLQLGTEFRGLAKQRILDEIRDTWKQFQDVFTPKTLKPDDLTNDMFCVEFWVQAIPRALEQAEETFCDIVGVRLFGVGYLKAFAYLLSPSTTGTRSLSYPNMRKRVSNLQKAADQFRVLLPPGYLDLFEDRAEPSISQSDKYRLLIADRALDGMITTLLDRVEREISTAGFPPRDDKELDQASREVQRICSRFELLVPAEGCRCLADILNAAWRSFEDESLWSRMPHVQRKRDVILKELVLKNIEVFEIEQILRGTP